MLPPDTTVSLLHQFGYVFLFLIAIVEGPIVTIIGAFLASQGYFNVFVVYLMVTLGDLCGDLLYYCVGRFSRAPRIASICRSMGIEGPQFDQLEQYIERHGPKLLFLAKWTQLGFLALPAAGAARMPVAKFLWCNALGTIPKSFALIVVGYFFGYAYNRIDGYLAKASLIGLAICCVAIILILLRRIAPARYDER
jgi:membrane protein DedA with SNARE-associated domain